MIAHCDLDAGVDWHRRGSDGSPTFNALIAARFSNSTDTDYFETRHGGRAGWKKMEGRGTGRLLDWSASKKILHRNDYSKGSCRELQRCGQDDRGLVAGL